jgi:hypothetical protein
MIWKTIVFEILFFYFGQQYTQYWRLFSEPPMPRRTQEPVTQVERQPEKTTGHSYGRPQVDPRRQGR